MVAQSDQFRKLWETEGRGKSRPRPQRAQSAFGMYKNARRGHLRSYVSGARKGQRAVRKTWSNLPVLGRARILGTRLCDQGRDNNPHARRRNMKRNATHLAQVAFSETQGNYVCRAKTPILLAAGGGVALMRGQQSFFDCADRNRPARWRRSQLNRPRRACSSDLRVRIPAKRTPRLLAMTSKVRAMADYRPHTCTGQG